nr:succinate dehydrogenase assembly factor 4 [Acidocella sp.]
MDKTPATQPGKPAPAAAAPAPRPKEIGGPSGPEPTRYGDWEKNGRCSDF